MRNVMRQQCEVCGATTRSCGTKVGSLRRRTYHFRRCEECSFTFVEDPETDFDQIYDEAYYRGRGADPLIDYEYEWRHHEQTIRNYEWQGIAEVVRTLTGANGTATWLDYGCGNGGLLRWLQGRHDGPVAGYDSGFIVHVNRRRGLPMLDEHELKQWKGRCDVVTAIEVLEHIMEPVATVQAICDLLRPGGLFFYTTGNASPHRGRIASWAYAIPEIHISYYEPTTMERVLQQGGFAVKYPGYVSGFDRIIQYKTLKNLRIKSRHPLWSALPWSILSRAADRRHRVSDFPVGFKPR